jgi:hypothetical protein
MHRVYVDYFCASSGTYRQVCWLQESEGYGVLQSGSGIAFFMLDCTSWCPNMSQQDVWKG